MYFESCNTNAFLVLSVWYHGSCQRSKPSRILTNYSTLKEIKLNSSYSRSSNGPFVSVLSLHVYKYLIWIIHTTMLPSVRMVVSIVKLSFQVFFLVYYREFKSFSLLEVLSNLSFGVQKRSSCFAWNINASFLNWNRICKVKQLGRYNGFGKLFGIGVS